MWPHIINFESEFGTIAFAPCCDSDLPEHREPGFASRDPNFAIRVKKESRGRPVWELGT